MVVEVDLFLICIKQSFFVCVFCVKFVFVVSYMHSEICKNVDLKGLIKQKK